MPDPDPVRREATIEDFYAMPEGTRADLIDGVIYTAASPLPRHAYVQQSLAFELVDVFDRRKRPAGWWILQTVDLKLGRNVVCPDLVGWRRERMPRFPQERPCEIVPDWVCEILSPSNHRHDRGRKAAVYAKAGVPHLWFVDPAERIVEAWALEGGRWTLLGSWADGDVVGIAPFDEHPLDIAALFPPDEPLIVQEGP